MLPPAAAAKARSSCDSDSLTWKVPAKAASGATVGVVQPGEPAQQHVDLDLGAFRAGRPPRRRRSAGGEQVGEDGRADGAQHEAPGDGQLAPSIVTSPSGLIAVTSVLVRRSAPASRAARSSSAVTWPMPPTGTSQSPVPPPITW